LLNTIILLSSGISVTWTHHSIINKNIKRAISSLSLTIFLGVYFSTLQLFEYLISPFNIRDGIFGSSFFLATGFHGLHVLIGTIFLSINLFRIPFLHFNSKHHFRFEAAA
ncbi:cytochrome c oxidase subunit 3, partial [Campylobacter jejuni]